MPQLTFATALVDCTLFSAKQNQDHRAILQITRVFRRHSGGCYSDQAVLLTSLASIFAKDSHVITKRPR